MPRQGRKDDVLAAAIALFSRKGYHGTTVRDIADEAGMLSGSLYAHYSSKEEMLFDIVQQAAGQFISGIGPMLESDQPAADKLRAAMRSHLRVMALSRDAAAIYLHEWKALTGDRRTIIAEKRNAYEEGLAAIIRQGVEAGEFRPVDAKFARLLVLSALNWLYQWYDPAGALGPDAVADKFADLVLHGLTNGEEGASS
ncbi:MAG: transcriptional regulator, TetR family [Symbiobacteriaceae bacterium]|nr:transcriptional regulator, TetR family [Symbiobacteriaceae bacterium]